MDKFNVLTSAWKRNSSTGEIECLSRKSVMTGTLKKCFDLINAIEAGTVKNCGNKYYIKPINNGIQIFYDDICDVYEVEPVKA